MSSVYQQEYTSWGDACQAAPASAPHCVLSPPAAPGPLALMRGVVAVSVPGALWGSLAAIGGGEVSMPLCPYAPAALAGLLALLAAVGASRRARGRA